MRTRSLVAVAVTAAVLAVGAAVATVLRPSAPPALATVAGPGTTADLVPVSARAPAPVAASSGARLAQASDAGPRWLSLSADQREILAPLESEWPRIDVDRKQKWLALAGRYRSLPRAERDRIRSRMQEWVRLSPQERGRTRLVFEEAKQVPSNERQARWEKYQALPPEQRQKFEAEAAARHDTAVRAARAGRAEPTPASAGDGVQRKVNATPAKPAPGAVPLPVAPTVVRAGQGATTRLIGQTPAPPAHQQAGMPKIATTPDVVNRTTLLPRRESPASAATATASAPVPASTAPPTVRPVPEDVARKGPPGSPIAP